MHQPPDKQKAFVPVMLTPFTNRGEVDYEALDMLTHYYIDAGSRGLFANCLSSEMFELTERERLRSVECIVRAAAGRVPVIATGTFGGPLERQAAFCKELYALGVQAVIISTGVMANEDEADEVLDERVMKLLELTPGIPMGFYECPVPYKRLISPAQLKKFVDTGRIIYHKDTSLKIDQVALKVSAGAGSSQFGLYDAYMAHAVQSLQAGAAGLSCIQGNYFPELVVWLCDHYDDAALKNEVLEVQQFFTQHMEVMHKVYPHAAKYLLHKRGLPINPITRKVSGFFSESIQQRVDQLFNNYQQLEARLGLHLAWAQPSSA